MIKRKKNNRTIYLTISIMVLFSVYTIYMIINTILYIKGRPEDIIYKSNVQDKTNYNVYLTPNDFIESVDNTESYITSLVDYIKINFGYIYVKNSNTNINYSYNIKATIISDYISDNITNISKPIWKKEFILLNKINKSTNKSTFNIKESIDIDTKYYNQLIDNFRNTLNIPIDSKLEVKLTIYIDGNILNNQNIKKEYYILATIPIGVKAFDIDLYNNFDGEEIIYSKSGRNTNTNYVYTIIYIILLIFNIYIGLKIINRLINKDKNKSTLLIKKILKEYDEKIITVSNFIKYKKLEIVEINSFDELLDLSEETLEPIIYWQKNKDEAWFSIIRNKVVYRYIIFNINKKP